MPHHLKIIKTKCVPDIQRLIGYNIHQVPEDITVRLIPSKLLLYMHISSAGYPPCSALPDCPAGPDRPSVPGQEEAPGGDGSSVGPERGAGEKVSGLQEGAG